MEERHHIGLGLHIEEDVEFDVGDNEQDVMVRAVLRDGRYVCTELVMRDKGSVSGITSESLRDRPVGFYVRWAAENANEEVEEALLPKAQHLMGPEISITDDLLEVVAAAYRWGYAIDGAPTAKVVGLFGFGRSRAGRWIAEARRRCFLGPTEMRRPGGVSD
ncbi:MAG: hypothetical protein LC667_08950 [Thioalkalivibrio sp.]|nr:hypothetical protein [Thioalkalivibrio sp.]